MVSLTMTSSNTDAARERIVYVAPDCTDAAVHKRARGFVNLGHALVSFSFRRARYNVDFTPDWPNVELGQTTERRLLARVLTCLGALGVIWRHRGQWRAATVLYARNLDLAILTLLAKTLVGARARFVYEVLDIHPALANSSLRSKVLRWIERRVLKRSQLVVVSSPAFLRSYFRKIQGYSGTAFLLENKWPKDSISRDSRTLPYDLPRQDMLWTIGWFGNLRCQQSLEILTELADALPTRVIISMCGCASLLGERVLQDKIEGRENMVYRGEYNAPEEIRSIYEGVHFNWCADFSDGHNSHWLLPNRLYEGGYFGVPALAIAAHETGRVVHERGLGFALDSPVLDHLKGLLANMTPDDYIKIRHRIERRPASDFVDTGELAELMNMLQQPQHAATSTETCTEVVR